MTPTDILPCGCPRGGHGIRHAGVYQFRRSLNLPHCTLGKHRHPEARIVFPLAGRFRTSHGKRELPVSIGTAMYRPAWDEHEDSYDGPVDSLALLLPADAVCQGPFVMRDPALQGVMRSLQTEWDIHDSAASLVMEGLATLLTSVVQHHRPVERRGKTHWIAMVRDQLEASYATTPTLAALAHSVDRDATYVAATFKKVYGTSVGTYLREWRLWQARSRMEREDMSLAMIALECGYSDQSHFTRQFKRLFSVTPAGYRRRHRLV
jgi:AraC family transcriptional regulator